MNSASVKKVFVVGIFLIMYILWQALGTLSEYYPINNYPPAHDGPILLFGDALATTSDIGYVGILEKRLGVNIEVVGYASSTIESTAREAAQSIVKRRPSVVIFSFGDVSDKTQWSSARHIDDLRRMIRAAQNEGAVTVLMGARREKPGGEGEREIKKLARETRSIAAVNILSTIADKPEYWDGNVPNTEGYLRIADLVAPTLEGLTFGITQHSDMAPAAEN